MKILSATSVFILLLFLIPSADAQSNRWGQVDTAQGLASMNVQSIAIEHDSAIWIATDQGLSLFNGTQLTSYSMANSQLNSNNIFQVEVNGGLVWMLTSAGISKFDGSNFSNYSSSNGLTTSAIEDLAVDGNGNVWIGTLSGVQSFDGNQFTTYSTIKGKFIEIDSNNHIYAFNDPAFIGTNYPTVHIFDGNNWNAQSATPSGPTLVNDVFKGEDGTIYMSAYGNKKLIEITYPFQLSEQTLSFKGVPNASNYKLAVSSTDRWAVIGQGTGFFKSSDTVFNRFALGPNIYSPILHIEEVELSSSKVYVASNIGLLVADRSTEPSDPNRTFNFNQISTSVDPRLPLFVGANNNSNFEYPAGSNAHLLYTANFISVVDPSNGPKYVIPQNGFYNSGTEIGPVNTAFDLGSNYIASVSRAEINNHKQNFGSSSYNMPAGILEWPANGDSTIGVAADLAPFFDFNRNGCYDPENGDYPIIKGDYAVYWITHTRTSNIPLEFHYMMYSFNSSTNSAFGRSIFLQYRIINRSNTNLNTVQTGMFIDGDVGNALDDYLGTDSLSNTCYFYNGTNFDNTPAYGVNTPVVGVRFLSDSLIGSIAFNFNGGPNLVNEYENALNGRFNNGNPQLYQGDTSKPTFFVYTGDPLNRTGWTEFTPGSGMPNPPGDRRMIAGMSPYNLAAGQSRTFEIAVGVGRKDSVNSPQENVPEVISILNQAKSIYDTLSMNNITYGSNFNCSLITGIEEADAQAKHTTLIYPNPAREIINIRAEQEIEFVEVFNLKAQLLIQKRIQSKQHEVQLNNLPEGLYLLRLHFKDQHIENQKFIISR